MTATEGPINQQESSPAADGLDAVTGLPGETFWNLLVASESARCARYGRVSTVVLVSIVGLEGVAQPWGQEVVDTVLVKVARALRSSCRASDYVARVGDARFGVLLTETAEIAAINMVERVRDRCQRDLSGMAPGVRVAFGWASPSATGTVVRAAVTAESRLRREAGRVIDDAE